MCSCKGAPTPGPAPAASGSAAPATTFTTRVLHVDPALVAEGRVRLVTAELRTPRAEAWVPGEIVPTEQGEADVTALAPGRVATLDVALGDAVHRGQVVATIDSPEVGRASADVLRAKSRALLAERALARQVELESQEATSKAAVDQARADDAAARADLLAARTLLASLGGSEPTDLGARATVAPTRVALRSPIEGVVTRRMISLGAPVSPDKALLHVVARDSRVAMAKVPETLQATTTGGTRVRVRPRSASVDHAGECGGTVLSNLGVVDEARNVPVRVGLDDACVALPAGRFVEVSMPIGGARPDAGATLLLVPEAAVTDVRGSPTVFVADGAEGAFAPRIVRAGAVMGSDVVIESGLSTGERVVADGAVLLKGEMLKAELQ